MKQHMLMVLVTLPLVVFLRGTGSMFTVYRKVGDDVTLQPGAVPMTDTIKSILWKHGADWAMEWHGEKIYPYRQFKVRCTLNLSNGEMTIKRLTQDYSGLYTSEINYKPAGQTLLKLISSVPEPTISTSCNEENIECTLTCDGNTTAAEPVTYTWKSDESLRTDSSKELNVTKEEDSSIVEFSCELKNPVSQESSQSILNPLTNGGAGIRNRFLGVVVFFCLVIFGLLMVGVHRYKTGVLFYEKESKPWEADFWRKQDTNVAQHDPESPGVTVLKEIGTADENKPMT